MNPSNVLVIYNADDPAGVQIKDHYLEVHGSAVQTFGYHLGQVADEVSADYYLQQVRQPLLESGVLTDDIEVIVTTKGMPLRIDAGSANLAGSSSWKRYSSLESELTRVDTVSTTAQMGDQDWLQIFYGQDHQAFNPYFNAAGEFDRENPQFQGIRLTSRLDGFTAGDVIGAIDRAQVAYINRTFQNVVVDDDPTAGADNMQTLVSSVLTTQGQTHIYNTTNAAVTSAPTPVIGYVSHGANDGGGGLSSGYINDQLDFDLANGAIFHTHESYNAYGFNPGDNVGQQGLVAEWLAIGGTAGVGHVEEPLNGLNNVSNENILFDKMLKGFTFVEAAWASMWQLSYVNTVVGDPLMTWDSWLLGDLDFNGKVNSVDYSILASNFGSTNALLTQGDLDFDSDVDFDDLNLFVQGISLARQGGGASGGGIIPEPTTALVLSITVPLLLSRRRRAAA